MNTPIIVAPNAVGPEPLAEDMGAVPGQLRAQAADQAHSRYTGCFGTILGTAAFARVKGWLGIGEQPPGQPARLNLLGGLRALRSPIPSRVQRAQQSFRVGMILAGPTARHYSVLSAGRAGLVAISDGHRDSERKIGNVRKAVGEIQYVER